MTTEFVAPAPYAMNSRSKECGEFPGVSLYHAEHVAPGSKPLSLEETLYYKELTKILGRVQLTSKQLIYGGDRTVLSGMAADKFSSSLFITSWSATLTSARTCTPTSCCTTVFE